MSRVLGLVVAGLGVAVCVGWATQNDVLKRVHPSLASMKLNTALCFVLAGAALGLWHQRHSRAVVATRRLTALLVVAIAGATLFQYVVGVDLGIDQLIIADDAHQPAIAFPGRMSPITAIGFSMIGLALCLLEIEALLWAQWLALIAAVLFLVSSLGYLYGAPSLYAVPGFTSIALHTSLGLLSLSVGVLLLRPEVGFLNPMTAATPSAALVRRLLPAVVILPITLGWLRLLGQRQGWYNTEFGLALNASSNVICLAGLTWWTAASFWKLELARRLDQEALQRAASRLATLATTSRQFAASNAGMKPLLNLVARSICELVGDFCTVRMIGPDGKTFDDVNTAAHHSDPEVLSAYWDMLRRSPHWVGKGVLGKVAAEGVSLLIPHLSPEELDALAMPEGRALARRLAISSIIAVPIKSRERTIGVIAVCRTTTNPYTLDDQKLTEDLADRAALAIDNCLLIANLESRLVDLERAEEKFRMLLESAPDAMVIVDNAGKIVLINAQTEALFGYRRQELLSQPVEILMADRHRSKHPGLRGRFFASPGLRHAMAPGREVSGLRKDGTEFSGEISLSPITTSDGPCVTAVVRDVTERKRLEEFRRKAYELTIQNERALEASRLKSEFLANMSHELRTPLNAILGFASLMESGRVGPLEETHKEYLGDIISSGKHLLQLINEVLDLTKVESGNLELKVESIDLARTIDEVHDVLRALVAERDIRVEVSVDPTLTTVVTDQRVLKQILFNYLSNAIKFTPDGGRVALRASPQDEMFLLEVEDTGIGIKAQDLHRLFVEFQQLDASTSKRYPGTGLGLALTKRLVEAQGGRVGVTSTPGVGSTFSAWLPRVVTADAAERRRSGGLS